MMPSLLYRHRFVFAAAWLASLLAMGKEAHAALYWNTNGTSATWTDAVWWTNATGTNTSAWLPSSDVVFGVSSNGINSATFATTIVGDITVNGNTTITAANTLSSKTGGSTVTVASGVTLTWTKQSRSTTANKWIKNGAGAWDIGAPQGSGGGVGSFFTLNEGTVIVSGALAFGATNSLLTINGGTIQSSGGSIFANTNVVFGGNFGFTGSGNDNYVGSVSLGSLTRTITNTATGLRIFSGVISGSSGAGLTLEGTGTTTLAGANTYSGNTTVNGGVLQISNVNALQNSTLDTGMSGSQSVNFAVSGDNTYYLGGLAGSDALSLGGNSISVGANNASTTFAGDLSATSGGLTKAGNGTLTFSGLFGATNLVVASGEFALGAADRITNTAAVAVSGGKLSTAYNDTVGSFSISGTGELSGAGTLTAATYTLGGGTVSGNLGAGTATASSGTTALNGTLAGNLTISGGTVNLGSADRIGNTSAVTVSSGALALNGNDSVGAVALTGGEISGSGTLTGTSYDFQSGTMGASLGGSATLTKTGSGTVTLAGDNTGYGGSIDLQSGALRVANNNALGAGAVGFTNGSIVAASGAAIANNFTIGTAAKAGGTNNFTVSWNFGTTISNASPSSSDSVIGFSVGDVSRGDAAAVFYTNSTSSGYYSGASGGYNVGAAAAAGALDTSKSTYFTVTLTRNSADSVVLQDVSFGSRSTSTGPIGYSIFSAADLATVLASGALQTNSNWALQTPTFTDTFIDAGGGTSIRIYGYGGTGASAGNWRIDDLTLKGQSVTNAVAAAGTGTLGIDEAGSAVFSGNVTVNNTATLTAAAGGTSVFSGVIGGAGSITKLGAGTVKFSGASANTFTNAVTVSAGTLELAKTAGVAALAGNVTVASGATLLISQSEQVNNNASVTLSGGTITRGSGVSEVFGNLNVSQASFLDFGAGTAGNLTFGTYAPSSLLTVNNFFGGNTLVFGSDLTSSIAVGTYNTNSYTSGDGLFTINSISGGFTASLDGGTFTITAIPEPSTYLAAAALAGFVFWPSRRTLTRMFRRR